MNLELQIALAFSHALLDAIVEIDQCAGTKEDLYRIVAELCARMEDMTLRIVTQATPTTPTTPITPITPTKESAK